MRPINFLKYVRVILRICRWRREYSYSVSPIFAVAACLFRRALAFGVWPFAVFHLTAVHCSTGPKNRPAAEVVHPTLRPKVGTKAVPKSRSPEPNSRGPAGTEPLGLGVSFVAPSGPRGPSVCNERWRVSCLFPLAACLLEFEVIVARSFLFDN